MSRPKHWIKSFFVSRVNSKKWFWRIDFSDGTGMGGWARSLYDATEKIDDEVWRQAWL